MKAMNDFTDREILIYMAGLAFGIICGNGNKSAEDQREAKKLFNVCMDAHNHLVGLPVSTEYVFPAFEKIRQIEADVKSLSKTKRK